MRPFPQLTSRKKSLTILDLMVVVGISALPMAALGASGRNAVAIPLSVFLMVTGYVLWWLPALAAPERRRWLDVIALPVYMGLCAAYLLATLLTWYFAPYAVVMVIAAQVIAFVYLSFRP
jgi:hypothetical protein